MRKLAISLIIFLSGAALAGQTKGTQGDFSPARLGNVLYCLQAKMSSIGYAPPRFNARSFRIRYVYGKWSPIDEDDELHMVVYGPSERSAILFEVYLQTKDGKQEIFIGEPTTFKKEHGVLVVDELPGGQATLRRIEALFHVISYRPVVTVMDSQVKAGPEACVYER